MRKNKFVVLIAIILIFTMVLSACVKPKDKPEGDKVEGLPSIKGDSTLEDVNKIVTEGKNYTVTMNFTEKGIVQQKIMTVVEDKIVDVVTFTAEGKNVVETTACTIEGGKYYEYINRKVTNATSTVSAVSDENDSIIILPEINTKREVTKEYYDSKYNEVVNVYIPLMDSSNYELKDGNYVLKEDKVKDFATRMSTSVADAKKITIKMTDGKANFSAPADVTICGKKGLGMELKPTEDKTVELPSDIKSAVEEGLTINNAYERSMKGFHMNDSVTDVSVDSTIVLVKDSSKLLGGGHLENGKWFSYAFEYENKGEWTKFELPYDYAHKMTEAPKYYAITLHPSYWKADGDKYAFNTANETEIRKLIKKAALVMAPPEGHDDIEEVVNQQYNSLLGATLEIKGDKIIIQPAVTIPGMESDIITYDGFGNVLKAPEEWKNARIIPAPGDIFEPTPDPDEPGEAEGDITIDNLYNKIMSESFTMNLIIPDGSMDLAGVKIDANAMFLINKGVDDYAEAYGKQDGKYYWYCKDSDGSLTREEIPEDEFDEAFGWPRIMPASIVGADSSYYELKNGKYVVKADKYDEFIGSVGGDDMSSELVSSLEITINADSVVVKLGLDSKRVTINLSDLGKTTVVISDDMKNAPIVEREREMFARCYIVGDVDLHDSRIEGFSVKYTTKSNPLTKELVAAEVAKCANYTILGYYSDSACLNDFGFKNLERPAPLFVKVEGVNLVIGNNDGRVFNVHTPKQSSAKEIAAILLRRDDYIVDGDKFYSDSDRTIAFDFTSPLVSGTWIYISGEYNYFDVSFYTSRGKSYVRFDKDAVVTRQMLSDKLLKEEDFTVTEYYYYDDSNADNAKGVIFDFKDGITSETKLYITGEYNNIRVFLYIGRMPVYEDFDKGATITKKMLSNKLLKHYNFKVTEYYYYDDSNVDNGKGEIFDFKDGITTYIELYVEGEYNYFMVYVYAANGKFAVRFDKDVVVTKQMLSDKLLKEYGYTVTEYYDNEDYTNIFDFKDGITSETWLYITGEYKKK